MNGFFKRKYGAVLCFGIFIAIGLTYWFGIKKVVENIRVQRDAIQEILVARENRNHQLGRLAEYDSQYEKILDNEKLFDIFTTRDNMIEFVRRIESLAEENDVNVVLEAREVPKIPKKSKASVDAKKTNEKDEVGGTATPNDKDTKKDRSIIENLPSKTYTYLGLHVTGETEKVIAYLNKVETLPIALDIVSVDALRKENSSFEDIQKRQSLLAQDNSLSNGLENESTTQVNGNPFSIPETQNSPKESVRAHAFELEVTANLVVYHPKE